MKTVWVLTSEINAYDQEGAYFEAVFVNKPVRADLLKYLFGGNGEHDKYNPNQHKVAGYLLKGGGRISSEYQWYNLIEVKSVN